MFINVDGITQFVSDAAGQALLSAPQARKATAGEAASCVNTLVAGGDIRMHEANENWSQEYGVRSTTKGERFLNGINHAARGML